MCGRFSSPKTIDKIAQAYKARPATNQEFVPSYNVAPTDVAPMILENENLSSRVIVLGEFGISTTIKGKIIPQFNMRDDNVANHRFLKTKRCIIEAGGFYEWEKVSTKDRQPYYFSPKIGSFLFAGVWKLDDDGYSFSIFTTSANQLVSKIHNRMPVILTEQEANIYLDQETKLETVLAMLNPYPVELMQMWKVSKDVNKSGDQKHAGLINSI